MMSARARCYRCRLTRVLVDDPYSSNRICAKCMDELYGENWRQGIYVHG